MEDESADPYLPYDGGGDTIPLQEIRMRGNDLFPTLGLYVNLAFSSLAVSVQTLRTIGMRLYVFFL